MVKGRFQVLVEFESPDTDKGEEYVSILLRNLKNSKPVTGVFMVVDENGFIWQTTELRKIEEDDDEV